MHDRLDVEPRWIDKLARLASSVQVKILTRWLLGTLFVVAGILHFVKTPFYVAIMPPYLPWHLQLVYISGAAEAALGALLLIRRWVVWAAWGLIALIVAVFPANVHMAIHADLYPSIPEWALWLRLPFQGFLIAWAYWYTRGYTPGYTRGRSVEPRAK